MCGCSVTRRAKSVKQPRGGYIPLRTMEATVYDDGIVLGPETVAPDIAGLAVDYLTRLQTTGDPEEAFFISLRGAEMLGRTEEAEGYLSGIKGSDDTSIRNACRIVWFDSIVRGAVPVGDPEDISPDAATCSNIRTMVGRTVSFYEKVGPVVSDAPTFRGGYTETVDNGDGDLVTEDTFWDIKTSKNPPKTVHTLQLAMYWIMGRRSVNPELRRLERIGIYNPRLNTSWTLDMGKVPEETIEAIERDVICYRRLPRAGRMRGYHPSASGTDIRHGYVSMRMVDDRRLWAEEETLFLFRVFLTEKAGSLSSNSPRIVEIAELLNRRTSSIHRKLEDIRSNEPSYIARGRKPTNCAELVKDVWKGLYFDYDRTRRRIEDAYTSVNGAVAAHEELDLEEIPPGLDIPVDATRREGQQLFRCIVAMNFEQRCCITGLATRDLLVASHIKPWVESGPEERTDPSNGLYLNRLHDGLFDRHLMTLDDDMCIEYADLVRRENSEEAFETFFGRYEGRRIREPSLYSVDTEFLDEHRRISHRMWADSRSRILEGRDDTGDRSFGIAPELAFPDDHDRPPICFQGGGLLRIPFDVPTELRDPVV